MKALPGRFFAQIDRNKPKKRDSQWVRIERVGQFDSPMRQRPVIISGIIRA